MTNISNIFYWDIKTNKKVSLSDVDKIKTSNLVRCKIKEDRITVEPFDETDSKFSELKAWNMALKIKNIYKSIIEFVFRYKKQNKWNWHCFYKKNNDIIMIVEDEEDKKTNFETLPNENGEPQEDKKTNFETLPNENDEPQEDEETGSETSLNGIESNNKSSIKTIKTTGLEGIDSNNKSENDLDMDNILSDLLKPSEETDIIENSSFQKISDENFKNFLETHFKEIFKNINLNNVEKVKKIVSTSHNINELQTNILSFFEDMGEILNDDINNLLNLDSSSSIERGTASYSKGMGAFFKVQSIVNDGSIQSANDMYDNIQNNLNNIESESNKNKNYDLAKLAEIYVKFLENWKSGSGSTNVEGSANFRNNMTSYFPEVLTPFTILWGKKDKNSNCIDAKGHEAIKKIKRMVGKNFNNPSISFPQSDYQPLFDSVLYFPSSDQSHKAIRLSTKGGKNGLGAQASISGLLTYFYKKDKLPQDIFTKKFWSLDASNYENAYQDYMYAFALKPENEFALKILSAFMLASSNQYHRIVNKIFDIIINQDEKYNKEFEKQLDFYNNITDKRRKKPAMIETLKARVKGLIVQKYINDHKEFQDCVLAALKYASFDFAQVNYKETGNDGDDFHYEIFVQYPAIFDGEIRFELMQGLKFHKLKFHILGSNIEH